MPLINVVFSLFFFSAASKMLIDPACVWQSECCITVCVCVLSVYSLFFWPGFYQVFPSLRGTDSSEKSSCLWFSHQNRSQTAWEGLHSTHKYAMCHDLTTAQNQADKLWNREFCRGRERVGKILFCHIPLQQMTWAHTQCIRDIN